MPKWAELEKDPEFIGLDYASQTQVREALFADSIAVDPEFLALPDQDKATVIDEFVFAPPVLSNPDGEFARYASQDVQGMANGDPAALEHAKQMSAARMASKTQLLPTVLAKGMDAVATLFDPDRTDSFYEDYWGKDGSKADQWLQMNIQKYGGEQALKDVATSGMVQGMAGGFVEMLAETVALGGFGRLAGGALQASRAGQAGVALAGGGKGLLAGQQVLAGGQAVDLAAKGSSIMSGLLTGDAAGIAVGEYLLGKGMSSTLIRNLAAMTAEGVTSGITSTGLDLLRQGIQNELQDPRKATFWTDVATNFGADVALNYVGYGMLKAFRTVGGALRLAAKGVKAVPEGPVTSEAILNAFEATSDGNPATKVISREYFDRIASDEALGQAKRIDPKNEIGLNAFAQANHYHIDFEDGIPKVMTNLDNPAEVINVASYAEAVDRLAEVAVSGKAAVKNSPVRRMASAMDSMTKLMRQDTLSIDGPIDPNDLKYFAIPEGGKTDPSKLKLLGQSLLRAGGVDEALIQKFDVIQTQGSAFGKKLAHGLQVGVSETVENVHDEAKTVAGFLRDVDTIIKENKGTPRTFNVAPPPLELGHASFSSVDSTAKSLGGSAEVWGNKITLKLPSGDVKVSSLNEANGKLIAEAYTQGKLSLDQIGTIVTRNTGYSLRKVEVPLIQTGLQTERFLQPGAKDMKREVFIIGKPSPDGSTFHQLDADEDLDVIFARHPEWDIRIPSTFAPVEMVVDPSLRKMVVQSTVAAGPLTEILELGGNFQSVQTPLTLFSNSKGSISKMPDDAVHFVLSNNRLGVMDVYSSVGAARSALLKQSDEVMDVHKAFATRGMKTYHAPDGTLMAVGGDSSTKRFETLAKAGKWLKDTPVMQWIEDARPFDPALLQATDAEVAKAAADVRLTFLKPSKTLAKLEQWIAPAEAALVQGAKIHGDYGLVRMFKELGNGFRLVEAVNAKAGGVVSKIFAGTTRKEQLLYNVLLGLPEHRWEQVAKNGFKHTITAKDRTVLANAAKVYAEAFRASGIDDWKKVYNYNARIREYANAHLDESFEGVNARELLEKAFHGEIPMGYSLFSENLRATEIIKHSLMENAQDNMIAYLYALNKSRLMDPIIKSVKDVVDNMEKGKKAYKYTRDELNYFNGMLSEMQGISKTPGERQFTAHSRQAFSAVQAVMRKVPGLRSMPMATEAQAGDLFDVLNNQITLGTQSKPWNILRNMAQIQLLGAAINNNRLMFRAFKEVVEEPASLTVSRVVRSGAVADSFFSHGTSATGAGEFHPWKQLLKINENMDIITRATAFKVSEHLIDDGWKRYKAGIIDLPKFAKEAQLSLLDETGRKTVLDALMRGDRTLAVDQLGNALNKLVFFDYSKMNRAGVMRGKMGKAFGKFMTYPAGTLSLYHKMAMSGSFGERAGRAMRMVLTSTAIYEGFKMAGIDYQGFLWTDPFGFGGGPLWTIMQELPQLGDNTPEGEMARDRLPTTALKLFSPTSNQYMQAMRAAKLFKEGKVTLGIMALGGSPIRKDLLTQ